LNDIDDKGDDDENL